MQPHIPHHNHILRPLTLISDPAHALIPYIPIFAFDCARPFLVLPDQPTLPPFASHDFHHACHLAFYPPCCERTQTKHAKHPI